MPLRLEADAEPIAGYRLIRPLGRGGFGEAWEAEAPGGVRIALKFIAIGTGKSDPEFRALEIIRNIRHPHLLDVQFAVVRDDYLVIATPLCDQSLFDRLQECQEQGHAGLPRDELLGYMEELAKAVDFLNEPRHPTPDGGRIGIQHRDIKPHNILLVGGSSRLADFGLVKVLEGTAISHTGYMSAHYVPPELLQGTVTHHSDQYSLAVTYYQLRTGRLPYSGNFGQVIYGHCHLDPDLSALPLPEREVVARGMARQPEARWPSCREFAAQLADTPPLDLELPSPAVALAATQLHRCGLVGDRHHDDSTPSTLRDVGTSEMPTADGVCRDCAEPARSDRPVDGASTLEILSSNTSPDGDGLAPARPPGAGHAPRRRRNRLAGLGIGVVALALVPVLWAYLDDPGPPVTPKLEAFAENPPPHLGTPEELPAANSQVRLEGQESTANARLTSSLSAADLAASARGVLKRFCYRCHGIALIGPGFNVLDGEDLTAASDAGLPPYVVPGRPDRSLLLNRTDPHGDADIDLDPEDRELLRRWIEVGAQFPDPPGRPPRSEAETLADIAGHLRSIDPADREFQRYFTLIHLHNRGQNVTDEDLRLTRAALAKAINSLSWAPRVVVPKEIDPSGTVLNVDLRDLGWSGLAWSKLLRAYPYGVTHETDADLDLSRLSREIKELSPGLPVIRADWFVAVATRPPLYHDLLELPTSAGVLERHLGIDPEADFQRDQLMRAAVAESRVAAHPRILDRHALPSGGSYWKTYEASASDGRGQLLDHPLGPHRPAHPFPDLAFEPSASLILFSLPNGLQGYLLVDGQGDRLDEAPTHLLRDPTEVLGTPKVVAGISCMVCHRHGVEPFQDSLLARSTLSGAAQHKLDQLAAPAAIWEDTRRVDESRFLDALAEAMGPFLNDKGDRVTIRDYPEPIGVVAHRYADDLRVADVAAELGMHAEALLAEVRASHELRAMGLGTLARDEAISRTTWEAAFRDVVSQLRLGTPRWFDSLGR